MVLVCLFNSYSLAQHDPGRDAVRLLVRVEIERAKKLVALPPDHVMHSPIDSAERHFVLALAACQEGQAAVAIEHIKDAVSEGLPIERVLASPGAFFKPLERNADFKAWLFEQSGSVIHGPMFGSLTATSARVWLRMARPCQVQLKVTANDSEALFSESVSVDPGQSSTVVIACYDLLPDTLYRCEILVDGVQSPETGHFRTFPKSNEPTRVKIGFGGGAGFTPQYHYMWDTVFQHRPNAFLMLGDNVYIDDPFHRRSRH